MKKYDTYKDSGVKWIGKVPGHWEVEKIRKHFAERSTKVSDKDYAPLSVTKDGILPQLETACKTENGDNRKLVRKGDYVVNSRSDRKGSCGISPYDGSVSLINIILSPIDGIGDYYHHLFRSNDYIEEFYRNGRGIVADLWTTRYQEMKNIQIPVPPLSEQQAIVDFLKVKTDKTDHYVAQREKERELLDSLKQAEIAKAVTQGLNPDVPMKDSGIPWIGMIPEHWEVKKAKRFLHLETNKSSNSRKIGLENIEGFTGNFIETGSTFDGEGVDVKVGDIVYGKLRPYLCKAWLATFDCNAVGDFYVFRCDDSVNKEYIHKIFLSPQFTNICDASTYGAKMPRVAAQYMLSLPIPFPPLAEQKAIAKFIESRLQKIDSYIADLQREIDYLKEFKQRLISDAVTGQIKVTD